MARALVKEIKERSKNYIINGAMEVAQRGTSFVSAPSGTYPVDRFQYIKSGTMVHTVSQDTDVPTFAQAGYYYQNSLRATLTTPDTSIAATDYNFIRQKIEGYNFANLAQKTFTLSFWVKATLVGTYCVSFVNSVNDRAYVAEYTITASNTWEYKTITVSPSPIAGTWNYTNGIGLSVCWVISSGSNFQTTANSWNTGDLLSTSNQVNGTNTGATEFKLTGVKVSLGGAPSEFSLFANDFAGEIIACERYFEKSYFVNIAPGSITVNGAIAWGGGTATANRPICSISFKVQKREVVVATYYNVNSGSTVNPVRDVNSGVDYPINTGANSAKLITVTPVGTPPATALLYVHFTADSEL